MFERVSLSLVIAGLLSGVALAQTAPPRHYPSDRSLLDLPKPIITPTKQQTVPAPKSPVVQTTSSNQPASLTITPTTLPEVLQVLDNTGTWVPIGDVNSIKHAFVPRNGEADIQVTDINVGMKSGNFDNLPFVHNLMTAISVAPDANNPGYDVLFPGIHGQLHTEYYFSDSFEMTRGGRYHCSGGGGSSSYAVNLVFAPGVDGVLEQSYNMSADGGGGVGTLTSCGIIGLGVGSAIANPVWNPNVLRRPSFQPDPAGIIPSPVWNVGDGLILTTGNGFYNRDSIFVSPIGTTVTAVDGTTGNITLSNPVTPYLGHVFLPKGTATFTQTGSNNFSVNDTIQVGATTYLFYYNTANVAGTVVVGKDFATSAANLVAAIMHGQGEGVTYTPNSIHGGNYQLMASFDGAHTITFTSYTGSPAVNTYPSVYTPATGTSAGAFSGATFTGANDASNCASPCTAIDQTVVFWQLPASKAYKIQSTAGSSTFTVVSGPKLLQGGDVVWSDAFPFGSTVWTYSNPATTTFPYTIQMAGPVNGAPTLNATVTHAPGSEGDMWIVPAGVKRRTVMSGADNRIYGFGLGLSMACSSANGLNCDGSRDDNMLLSGNFVGRWNSGNNYSSAGSSNEIFGGNYFTDIWEGGTLGMVYVNPNGNSAESGSSLYGFLMNCSNQNYTTIFGTYMAGGTFCTYGDDILHPVWGGPFVAGPLAGPPNSPGVSLNDFYGTPFQFIGGNDNLMCTQIGGAPGNGIAFAFSYYGCATNTTWDLYWDAINHFWGWNFTGGGTAMRFIGDSGYTGYNAGTMPVFPYGFQVGSQDDSIGNERLLDAGYEAPSYVPTRLEGDTRMNQQPRPNAPWAWVNINLHHRVSYVTVASAVGDTTITINGCPGPVPVGASVTFYNHVLGTFASCSGTTLTLQAAAAYSTFINGDLEFLEWRPTGQIANDSNGFSWPVSVPTDVASLNTYASCDGAHIGLATVVNGQDAITAGYNAPMGGTLGGTVRLVFCDGTSWTYH